MQNSDCVICIMQFQITPLKNYEEGKSNGL